MRRDFNQRAHQRNTEIVLLVVAFGLMLLIAGGLAWWQLGVGPAVCAVVAIGGGAALLGLLWLLMTGIERVVGPE